MMGEKNTVRRRGADSLNDVSLVAPVLLQFSQRVCQQCSDFWMISLQSGFPSTLTIMMCLLGEHLGKNWDALTHSPLRLQDFLNWWCWFWFCLGFFVCLFIFSNEEVRGACQRGFIPVRRNPGTRKMLQKIVMGEQTTTYSLCFLSLLPQ